MQKASSIPLNNTLFMVWTIEAFLYALERSSMRLIDFYVYQFLCLSAGQLDCSEDFPARQMDSWQVKLQTKAETIGISKFQSLSSRI